AGLGGTSRSLGQPATVTSAGLAGPHVKAWAVQKSNWAHWFGRRVRADDVAHDLAQRARRERRERRSLSPPGPPAGAGGRAEWGRDGPARPATLCQKKTGAQGVRVPSIS